MNAVAAVKNLVLVWLSLLVLLAATTASSCLHLGHGQQWDSSDPPAYSPRDAGRPG